MNRETTTETYWVAVPSAVQSGASISSASYFAAGNTYTADEAQAVRSSSVNNLACEAETYTLDFAELCGPTLTILLKGRSISEELHGFSSASQSLFEDRSPMMYECLMGVEDGGHAIF